MFPNNNNNKKKRKALRGESAFLFWTWKKHFSFCMLHVIIIIYVHIDGLN